MPRGSLTNLLAQELDYGANRLPKPGDRLRDYSNLTDPGNGVTHGRDGDWVVIEVEQFISNSGREVITCYCAFEPIAANWQALNRQGSETAERSLDLLRESANSPHPPTPSPKRGEGEPEIGNHRYFVVSCQVPLPTWERDLG